MVQAAHILVGGGTGFVGRHLVRCLRDGGAKVRVITRSPKGSDQISWIIDSPTLLLLDHFHGAKNLPTKKNKIKAEGLPEETTAVVNLAGRNILDPRPWTESFKREVYDSRINTNRVLADAIHSASTKPKAFVTISGVGYYPASNHRTGLEYDENWTQTKSDSSASYLMRLARDWEKASELDESKAPSTRRVVIRSGAVIGRGGGVVQNSKLPFLIGVGGPIGNGNQWFPWIHVDDLANMFKFSIANDHVVGVINGVAPEQSTSKDFAQAFGDALNRPDRIRLPEFVVKLMFSPERAGILLQTPRVKSRASLLGFRYQWPKLASACKEAVS